MNKAGDGGGAELDEAVVHAGPANHVEGWESRGGELRLHETCLIFEAHGENIQRHPVWIPLEEVTAVRPVNNALIIPSGLVVATAEREHRFVLWGRAAWVTAIEARRRALV